MDFDAIASDVLSAHKNKHVKGYFRFSVDMSDIYKELAKFNKQLGKPLTNQVAKHNPAKTMRDRMEDNISRNTGNTTSARIRSMFHAMRKNTKYTNLENGNTRVSGSKKVLRMETLDVNAMDKATNINQLDKLHPQYHKTNFTASDNKKHVGALAKKHRGTKRFALWRMFEYPTKTSYTIPKVARGPMKFTSGKNNYSSWIVSRRVRWFANPTIGVASSAYFILDRNRRWYKWDQDVFTGVVGYSVKKVLKKTRFKR